MMNRSEFLRAWRTDAGFSVERLSRLTGVGTRTIEQIEQGSAEPSFEELEALAGVLGLRAEELYDEQVPDSAPRDGIRLLMKSAEAYSPSDEARVRMLAAAAATRDLLDLQAEVRPARSAFERLPIRPLAAGASPYKAGEELARELRGKLAMSGPVASMRDLTREALGIPIVGAALTAHGPDAFSLYAPGRRAAIILNLEGKNRHPLVRRFSLAHELGHILFDRPGQGSFGRACQMEPVRALDVEARANAFAIRLLLPLPQLAQLGRDVLKPDLFRGLMEEWGVHFSALRLDVERELGLSAEEAREAIPDVDRTSPNSWAAAEELPEERCGLARVPTARRGPLAALVLQLLQGDQVSDARARELLGVDAAVPLEELAAEADVPLDQE